MGVMDIMENVKSNDQLIAGEFYHCFEKKSFRHSIAQCKTTIDDKGRKYVGERVWAEDNNNQALDRWVICGPITPPNVAGIMMCSTHGGIGFQSDCYRCKWLRENA